MITPIKTMTVNQIADRKDDLLMSNKDIKELARNERNKVIEEFAERLKSDEFQKYNLDMVFETSRDLSYSNCVNAFCEYVDKIAEEMRGAS